MRKKSFKKSLFFLIFFVLIFGNFNYCEAKSYFYQLIKVDIQINNDSTFDVVEKQIYNLDGSFGYFYRDIELKDLDHISDIEVFDDRDIKLNKGDYKVSYKGNNIHIQWDFPRRDFYNELKSWTIKYKVHGGVGFYENWDELYWNAIFSERDVLVEKADIFVHLPEELAEENIGMKMFIGPLGSKNESNNYRIIDKKTVEFLGSNIEPHEYLTIVLTWPKGLVKKPFFYRNQIINLMVLLIALALPIFVFIRSYIIWRKKGKDLKITKTIIAQYESPANLSSAEVGVLMNQTVQIKEIIATVVDLAVRGYLKIKEGEKSFFGGKEYIFEKLKDESNLKPFEQKIIRDIFGSKELISSKDLKNKFYKHIPEIKKSIYQEIEKTGLFTGNIRKIRKKYGKIYGIMLVLIFIGIWFCAFSGIFAKYSVYILIPGISLGISAIIGWIFAYYMPALTQKGLEAKWKALGFKEYLYTAERFRIGAETLEIFSKFLPFAMVFGVEKQWANRFSDFSWQEQNWYVPVYVSTGRGTPLTSVSSFSSNFSSFFSSVSRTFSSSPGGSGMGGGGGAGGGGGGGGGGAG